MALRLSGSLLRACSVTVIDSDSDSDLESGPAGGTQAPSHRDCLSPKLTPNLPRVQVGNVIQVVMVLLAQNPLSLARRGGWPIAGPMSGACSPNSCHSDWHCRWAVPIQNPFQEEFNSHNSNCMVFYRPLKLFKKLQLQAL